MSEKPRVLVVEDEENIRKGIGDVLVYNGYDVVLVETGDGGLKRAASESFGLILLDVMLPGMNGFEVCERVREAKPTQPIIMLTAKGSEEDVLRGFRVGADDYVTKPFSIRELLARIEAVLRRSGRLDDARAASFEFAGWSIDREQLRATSDGRSVPLTRREIAILSLLRTERGRIVSRRRMLTDVWEMMNPGRVHTRTVDVHIAKLRKKLGDAACTIETVHGEGYRYSGPG